jgi:prefoldin subunit 5
VNPDEDHTDPRVRLVGALFGRGGVLDPAGPNIRGFCKLSHTITGRRLMKQIIVTFTLCVLLAAGCNSSREHELEQQLNQTQSERSAMQQSIAERDTFIEEVMHSVNDVYADLEKARAKEALVKKGTGLTEGPAKLTNAEARQKLLQVIADIGAGLKENSKKIASLQARIKGMKTQIASLNTMVENLKATVLEREQSIAQLEARVKGLEQTVADNQQTIAVRDETITTQRKTMNTGFFVVGTRAELAQKGIIEDEGGFLWGLLGSTTVLSSGIDGSQFTPIDKLKDLKIQVHGHIDEILPRRKSDFFATNDQGEQNSELTIVNPDKFWQDRYLVIIVD